MKMSRGEKIFQFVNVTFLILLALLIIYPIVYNYSYLLAEAVITVIVISIPAVKKALDRVRSYALT